MKPLTPPNPELPIIPEEARPSGFRCVPFFWYGSGVMRAPPIAIGQIVAEKYVVERVLGEGGMGIVLAARHLELDQRVAIKCLLPEIAQRGVAAERFRREARAVANMRSEHVCRVLDVGTLADGIPFMIMEYLDGCDLSQELERRERLPYSEAVAYVLQACEALSEAHQAGIIHRDLKPANLFLEQRSNGVRRVKVLDFGVSKSLLGSQASNAALTQTANLVGSPLYMSPEQLESSRDVDARADIWGLGVVLYELIAGVPPFAAASIPQLIAAVLNERPRAFASELTPKVPAELEAVILRSLSKDRRDRTSSVEALMEELEPFAAQLTAAGRTTQLSASERAPKSGKAAPRSPTQTTQTPLSWDRDDKARPSRARWVIGAVLFALVAAGGLYAYSNLQHLQGEEAAKPAVAKPLPQAERVEKHEVGAATHTVSEPEPTEIPRGVAPEVPAEEPAAKGALRPTAAEQNLKPIEPQLPIPSPGANPAQPSAAKPVAARPSQAPAVNPVPIAKPAAPAAPAAHGAPPRGQVTNFGGRR